jgi:hypothetical protein
MSDLVERVARAIADANLKASDLNWEPEARAAIRVVLEEALSKAVHDPEIYHTIRAMIPKDGE